MNALNRQNIQVETGSRNLLVYTQDTEKWAISLARTFRNKGKNIEMLKRNTEEDRQVYEEYGKRSSVMTMLYLRDDLKIEMINFRTGEKKIMDTKSRSKGAEPMRYLTFALTKGRLASKTLDMLEKLGITCDEMKDKNSRKLIFTNEELGLRFFLAKGPDVPTYVEYGAADIGVVGKDTIIEEGRKVHEVLDLGFGKCRMCVCGREETAEKLQHHELIRVATKYPNIAKDYFIIKSIRQLRL